MRIAKKIKIPPVAERHRKPSKFTALLAKMKVGDSMAVNLKQSHLAYGWGYRRRKLFISRPLSKKVKTRRRIWRVK